MVSNVALQKEEMYTIHDPDYINNNPTFYKTLEFSQSGPQITNKRVFNYYNDYSEYFSLLDSLYKKVFCIRGAIFALTMLGNTHQDIGEYSESMSIPERFLYDENDPTSEYSNVYFNGEYDNHPLWPYQWGNIGFPGGFFNLNNLKIDNPECSPPIRGDLDGGFDAPNPPSRCDYQVRLLWRLIGLFCEDRATSNPDPIAHLNCNSLMYDSYFYGTNFAEEDSDVATWNNVVATKPIYTGFDGNIDTIVAESNIVGVSVAEPVFSSTSLLQFPAGLVINSTHPTIHTRIQRDLGDTGSSLESINCNVILLRTPNVRFENVEFDNAGCQEDALDIAASHSSNFLALAFKFYKGWNFAAVRLTKSLANADPTNISFVSVKFTSAENFRRKFPGRPLFSADNAARQTEWVNIDGLYVSDANDTFDYVVDSKAGTEVNLMPLDMIMWHYKGDVSFGFFSEYWEAVSYGPSSNSRTSGAFYSQASNEVVSSENCKNVTPIEDTNDYIYFVRYNRFASICCNVSGFQSLPEDQYEYGNEFAPICENSDLTIKNCTSFPSDDGEFYGYNTSQEYCQEKGGSECNYVEGQCRKNAVTVRDRLQILDGNDFFDLAADRFRCFDPLTIDCTSKMIAEAVTIVTVGIILMATIHYLYKGIKAFQEEPCISILESREQVLDEADPLEYADIDD